MTYRVGIIGCGGRGKGHAQGYKASSDVQIVACADPIGESRWAFQEEFGVERTYKDYQDMLENEALDIVSVCTWTEFHAEMVIATAGKGVKAIHCEKPMAPSWGAAKALYQVCEDHGVMITFCHQRRFEAPYRVARRMAHDGTIGQLYRVEGSCDNLFDWGTHWFDMFFFYNHDEPADWVMGQIDVSSERTAFGIPLESAGISWVRWKNGLEGVLAAGDANLQGAANRLVGTEGVIEVYAKDQPPVRVLRPGAMTWKAPKLTPEDGAERDGTVQSVLDLVDALKTGREPELSGRRALRATELIFATYESSRRRARIRLPLTVDDSALLTMLEQGKIGKRKGGRRKENMA
ncbi:MAG: Gfo/Idh/MocA family oxidoreductase [candidate division Zixibacteria bacterium]|nr:Gfo/Idh/MocA family oxidoreductase [candidate division Zixibacteria bacterium]